MSAAHCRRVVVPLVSLALASAVAGPPLSASPGGQQRSEASSSKTVPVQGSAGSALKPVAGAPEPPASSTAAVEVSARPGRPAGVAAPADPLASRLLALSTGEGVATVEWDGIEQVVRPGARLGGDTVKSVGPGRMVLERAPDAAQPAAAALVIVTFDAAGRARPRLVWSSDPTAPGAPEVKRP